MLSLSNRTIIEPSTALDEKVPLLLVGNFLSSSRASRSVCEDLAEHLVGSGWPVITTSSHSGRLARVADMVSTAWAKRHLYSVAHVDVYSGMAFLWAEAVCETLARARKPYLLTLHGGNLSAFAERWPRRVRRLLRGAAVVTTPSRYLREKMLRYRPSLRLLPNPLGLAGCKFRMRRQPSPKLIWVRAFHEIYNPALAPRVLKLLASEFPAIEMTMLGHDKQDGSLKLVRETAQREGVAGLLKLPGGVPQASVPDWLARNDIFLNTSDVDNTPVSVMEAMACGLCIVSTNVGGIPYLLNDGEDALLVPPDDPQAMAAAVRRLLTEPGLPARLSINARRKAERFDWRLILPQWEELLRGVARRA